MIHATIFFVKVLLKSVFIQHFKFFKEERFLQILLSALPLVVENFLKLFLILLRNFLVLLQIKP